MHHPQGGIHRRHPFVTPTELREPARRFRGRLVGPVTVWTAGGPEERTGLTMSSLVVAEGEPASVFGLVGETSELWEAVQKSEAFVVHVLEERHRQLADRFAGLRPSPGGLFRDLVVQDTPWGPVLADLATRAFCRLGSSEESGYHLLVQGVIQRIELHDLREPLAYYRGGYRRLRTDDR
ncbi:MAG: flavin reductase family protein [Actinomycetota bacterium]|nr:flavin reductase family protein [Actinomycetota bacterium]